MHKKLYNSINFKSFESWEGRNKLDVKSRYFIFRSLLYDNIDNSILNDLCDEIGYIVNEKFTNDDYLDEI
jgi:hypothetical protein